MPGSGSATVRGSAPEYAPGSAPTPDRPRRTPTGPAPRDRLQAWAELLRISALTTVPGDALTGAATLGLRPNRGTALALGASLCLYEAGMALNDWADRAEDAVDRPHRPIPSGRVTPAAALTAATLLTAAGLALASRAGRPALATATALTITVWSYDLRLKHTAAGPAAMGAARTLDLLLGATAARTPHRSTPATALPAALALGVHTAAVTAVSRHEAHGGSTTAPLAALATAAGLAALTTADPTPGTGPAATARRLLRTALALRYARTVATPCLHAALNPSPHLTRHAVGAGIRAMIPLQAALAARRPGPAAAVTALALAALAPLARTLSRRVSPT
ncbi:SCO3242 family prenyltransferase [Streptomyces sp. NPDC014894]|uniref:SCO3242 family prenyltransferase n=1 Tax=Streptomyces sp. NPDC014894 TaxID=3364931 RepID=UPI0037035D19